MNRPPTIRARAIENPAKAKLMMYGFFLLESLKVFRINSRTTQKARAIAASSMACHIGPSGKGLSSDWTESDGQLLGSPNCVFDASLVPGTCPENDLLM